MLDMSILLEIKYFNGSTFADNKIALGQAAANTVSITLATSDFIYVGYYKPINQIYLDIPTPNTNDSTVSIEYWNGTAWTEIQDIDGTLDLTASGLMQWEELSDWATTEVDNNEQYWVRISTDTLHTAATYNFIGLVLADDNDLLIHVDYIMDASVLPTSQTSHFTRHIAARDKIMQQLTNKGYTKIDVNGNRQSITAWDLLDIAEVRQAAIAYALHLIHFNMSDQPEDSWAAKSDKYMESYDKSINVSRLSIDLDDDGIKDDSENKRRSYQTMMYK